MAATKKPVQNTLRQVLGLTEWEDVVTAWSDTPATVLAVLVRRSGFGTLRIVYVQPASLEECPEIWALLDIHAVATSRLLSIIRAVIHAAAKDRK